MITYPNVKVNLGLSVLRRRPDGYHDLETLFVPYSGIHDTLEITPLGQWSENLCHPRKTTAPAELSPKYRECRNRGRKGSQGHDNRPGASEERSDPDLP